MSANSGRVLASACEGPHAAPSGGLQPFCTDITLEKCSASVSFSVLLVWVANSSGDAKVAVCLALRGITLALFHFSRDVQKCKNKKAQSWWLNTHKITISYFSAQ